MGLFNIAGLFGRSRTTDINRFREFFGRFQQILANNNRVLQLISELEDKLSGEYIFDINYLKDITEQISKSVYLVTSSLNDMSNNRYRELFSCQATVQRELKCILGDKSAIPDSSFVFDYNNPFSDMLELVGGKNARLSEIKNQLELCVPDGFIVSVEAYQSFMNKNHLWDKIWELRDRYLEKSPDISRYDTAIDELFEKALIPAEVEKDIANQLSILQKNNRDISKFAVRSSACGEDTAGKSFAGQFESYIGCGEKEILSAYARVVASKFKHRVIAYTGDASVKESDLPMAVGIQTMVDSETAGVAYSVDPSAQHAECLIVSAVAGQGRKAVDGTTDTDMIKIPRLNPQLFEVLQNHRTGQAEGDVKTTDDNSQPGIPKDEICLSKEQIFLLYEKVLMLERYFRHPVDVEWGFGKDGQLYILQCRPLTPSGGTAREQFSGSCRIVDRPTILVNKGQVAQRGIAAGEVHIVDEEDDLSDFPSGGIAVTKYTTPRLTTIIRRAAAIITDTGSSSGHMSTVAREFGIPTIVNTGNATEVLHEGMQVTVDADENVVYEGIVNELLAFEAKTEDAYYDLPEYYMLRQMLRRISPLYMFDPTDSNYLAKNCRTYHDIIRFCHEKAVEFLINLSVSSRRFRGVKTRELKLPIPLGLHLVDLGDGLEAGAKNKRKIYAEDIVSLPMQEILAGLIIPGVWSTRPMQMDLGSLMSSLFRISAADHQAASGGQNLAIISASYANINLHLGYHYNVIDSYVSDNVDDNYIYFRFMGGVTEIERRHLRGMLIKKILEDLRFRVTLHGDLIIARLKKLPKEDMVDVLKQIGRLIGFTRQLDTQMKSLTSISEHLEAFKEGYYSS